MKKILLLISWLLVASIVHAQDVSMDFIPFHNPGYGAKYCNNEMETLSPKPLL